MNLQDIVMPLGDFLTWTFDTLIAPAGNLPNYLFIAVITFGLVFWVKKQNDLNKKAEQEGTLK